MVGKFNEAASVTLSLSPSMQTSLTNIITGTDNSEIINGTSEADMVNALFGDDVINGSAGADIYDGGPGSDTVSYLDSPEAVRVNLTSYYQSGGHAEGDVLRDIENLRGSKFNDWLGGDGLNNILNGGPGADTLQGNYGADVFVFSSAAEANGDVVTDYSSIDALDFRGIANLKWVSITNDGAKTYLNGDVNGDSVSDFTVTLNGVHTQINGVNAPFTFPTTTTPGPIAPVITIANATAHEGSGQIVFTLTRSGDLSSASTVRYITTGITARTDYDYGWKLDSVTFAAGESTKTIAIDITDDQVAEATETFAIDFLDGTNVRLQNEVAIGTITDNDTIEAPSVSISDATVSEKDGEMVFTVTRTGSLNVVSTIDFDVTDESAWQEEDYQARSGTITFNIGESVKTIRLPVTMDNIVEGTETMRVSIYEGKNVTVVKSDGIGTITDFNANSVIGTAGNDTLNGTANSDLMEGLAGNDLFYGSAGADVINGGDGNDVVSYFNSKTGVNANLTRQYQIGGDAEGDSLSGIERLAGSTYNDILTGDSLGNVIDGHWGDDIINGGGGADWLLGGRGNDTFVFSSAADANGDFVGDWNAGDKMDLSAIDANRKIEGQQGFSLIGDRAFGKYAGELQVTNDGSNTFIAGDTDGDGKADFTIKVSGVQNNIAGVTPEARAIMTGTAGNDALYGTVKADLINTLGGDDVIYGSEGADLIDGGAGNDAVSYFASKAGVNVDLTRGVQFGGMAEGDLLYNVERIGGSAFNDVLRGDANGNVINGNAGNDVIEGGGGPDWMMGGAGNDRFVFSQTSDIRGDRISDFSVGDVLDFRGIDANSLVGGDQAFSYIAGQAFTGSAGQLRSYNDGVNTYLAGDTNGDGVADFTLTLDGLQTFSGDWLFA